MWNQEQIMGLINRITTVDQARQAADFIMDHRMDIQGPDMFVPLCIYFCECRVWEIRHPAGGGAAE